MKLNPFLQNNSVLFLFISIFFLILSNNTYGNTEDKVKNITKKLRCMTCQNQTIYDSDADFSNDIKKIVQKKLEKNQSEKEIINFLIERYGEYIVFEPQKTLGNAFLWLFPFVIFILSSVFLIFRINKN
jgi:cytochrome c-type biogenesis protein CcmH|tara:strand:+ start:602 stop:988 length:387 start_codon:yes stop_codon:yes gene_type:complete